VIIVILSGFLAYFTAGILGSIAMRFIGPSFLLVPLWLGGGVFIWFKFYKGLSNWWLRTKVKEHEENSAELLVNSTGIADLRNKQLFAREDIHRLVMKNRFDSSVDLPMSNMVVAGNAMTVGSMAVGNAIHNGVAALANAKRRADAAVAYQVTVEAGGKSHVLVGGLTEVCAFGLMTEIDRALNS
jgi:hypothetical protein